MDAELKARLRSALDGPIKAHPGTIAYYRVSKQLDALAPIIAEVEAAARADEREKAARIAEDEAETVGKDFHDCFVPQDAYIDACNDIAAAIRAQKEPTT